MEDRSQEQREVQRALVAQLMRDLGEVEVRRAEAAARREQERRRLREMKGQYGRIKAILGDWDFKEIARKAGLSRPYVSRVLRGHRGMTAEAMRELARALGVTHERLWRYLDEVRADPIGKEAWLQATSRKRRKEHQGQASRAA